ncbi:unnamed protein product [Pelagomonas calceolata]|uniref:SMODS and SLOG-associating 2TM effector domain-containing protein n=1 Tax=Pelagomonas calceolata TaxID=35677 RepID=A0A8J2SRM2_9STRA|nr:unnamed protein product [Pelagomonas calceolata]
MRRSMYLWMMGVAAALDLPRGGVTAMRGASNVIRKLGGASNSDSARHGDFFDRSEALLRTENELEELDGGQPAAGAVVNVLAWCVILGVVCGSLYLVTADAISKYAHKLTEELNVSSEPLQAALAVLGVLYSVLLGSTLGAAMTRQETQLHAVGAELAAAELLEGGLNDLDAPETEVYFQRALAAAAAHCRRLEASIDDTQRRGRRPKSNEKQRFVDPLADCAAALADARCPPTPLGARADLERLHEYRAQRRAAGAGPRFPSGHWVVLRTLGAFCAATVAVVCALDRGAAGGAVLVGVTATALALSETIVADVADRNSGMYTAARSFLPAVARLRARLERKAARAEARIEMAAASAKPAPKGLAALLTPPAPPPEPRPAASLDPGLS